MRKLPRFFVIFICFVSSIAVHRLISVQDKQQESYPVHPDSKLHENVPQGQIIEGNFNESTVFPGTERDYWVYIPKQYKAGDTAALMVFQDGRNYARRDGGYNVPNVFDNLIATGEMPVTIGLFINPGAVPAANNNAEARYNRSFEYDSVDDRYSQFLIDEFIPFVEAKHEIKLSDDPNNRAICGSSSGGICAFVVAWHRPDVFRRVFTTVGTYVGLRGGHELATLVRKVEPKPLRIYIQDGSNDLNIYGGDWWMANQALVRSLEFAGYEVAHTFGEGYHSGKHGAAIFPDVMRWLWKDHDTAPVTTHPDRSRHEASQLLVAEETWELVGDGYQWAEGLAVTEDGTLYFTDVPASQLYRLPPDGKSELIVEDTGNANGIALGPDGRLYGACSGAEQIRAWNLKTLEMEVISEGTKSNDIVVLHDGTIYYTDPASSKIWRLDRETHKRHVADQFKECNGIGVSADQTQLFVAHYPGRFIYSYTIAGDRELTNKQPYFHLEVPANSLKGEFDGMCSTVDGWLVASSGMGIQICDQPGRSHLILPLPYGNRRPCYTAFGGPDYQTLYVANVDKIWKRRTKLTGAKPWLEPVKPPKPRL